MCSEKRRGGGGGGGGGGAFIGYNKEENPTSNRCGIHIFQKRNTFSNVLFFESKRTQFIWMGAL